MVGLILWHHKSMPVAFNVRLQRRIYMALPLHLQTVGDFHFFCFNVCGLFFLVLLTPWLVWLGLTPIAWATGWSALSCVLIGWHGSGARPCLW